MKIKNHGNWGHGLRDEETHDLNCIACIREQDHAEGCDYPDCDRES